MTEIDVEPVERVDDGSDAAAADEGNEGDGSNGSDGAGGAGDAPVETVDAAVDLGDPDAPEYVLYGGKGGVGKTTMAAATALASASAGVPTLVVSTDPAHSLSDTLEVDVPADATRVRDDVPLWAAEIDPDRVLDGPFGAEGAFGTDVDGEPYADEDTSGFDPGFDDPSGEGHDGGSAPFAGAEGSGFAGDDLGGLGALLGEDGPLGGDGPLGMGGPMPGADEAAAMQQLLRYLDDPRFDRVVVDTAPTGHTLRLLELPEVMDSMLGRVMQLRDRFRGMMDGIRGLFGDAADDRAGFEELEELAERIERLRSVLRDPDRTDFRVVLIPEEMSVVESKRLVARLDEFGIPVRTIVVNRVMENLGDVADVSPEWVVSPNLEECAFCQRRWNVQQGALREASDLFRGRDVRRVPLLADEVRGEEALRVVAACLG